MDFVAAAREFAAGNHESALGWLLPLDQPVTYRLPRMLATGAVLNGLLSTAGGGPGPGGLAGELAAAGAELGGDAIRELITGRTGESIGPLVDVLAELVAAVARWEASGPDPEAAEKAFQLAGELL